MQANNRKRVFVLVLSLLFMFVCGGITLLFTPVQTARAIAITEEEAITSEYVDSLRYGYNVAGGRALCDDGLKISSPILKPMSEGLYKHVAKFEINSKTNAGNYIADSAVGIAKQSGTILSGGISAQVKVVNMDVSTSFNMQSSQQKTSQERFETFYQQIKHSSYIIQGNVDLRNYLTDDFKDDLLSVKSSKDAIALYNKYGTHLFTGFEYGGLLEITNYMKTDSNTVKLSNASSLSSKMAVAFNGYGGGTDFSFSSTFENEEKRTFGTSNYKVALYGGESITALSIDQLFTYNESMLDGNGHYVYDRWVKSINDGKKMAIIGTPSSARNVPLWELLPDGGEYGVAKQNMIQGYAELCGDKYKEFLEKYPTTPRTIGDTTKESDIVVSGYNVTYKGFTSYYADEDNSLGVYNVLQNSTIYINYKDNDKLNQKVWRIKSGNGVTCVDNQNGIFSISNPTAGSSFIIELAATMGTDDVSDDEILHTREFTVIAGMFSGGEGTENNPYLISTTDDFLNIGQNGYYDKHFKLINNLDFEGKRNSDKAHLTIGQSESSPFSGVFDGNNCSIKNLVIDKQESNSYGLFPFNKGTIKNLTLDGIKIGYYSENGIDKVVPYSVTSAGDIDIFVGGIVGKNIEKGFISNCKVTGLNVNLSITTKTANLDVYTGGIAGYSCGTIEQCAVEFSSLSASPKDSTKKKNMRNYVAGILGASENGKIEYSYVNNISLKSDTQGFKSRSYTGGLLGIAYKNTTIEMKNVIVGTIEELTSTAGSESTSVKESFLIVSSTGDDDYAAGTVEISDSYVTTKGDIKVGGNITAGYEQRDIVKYDAIKVNANIWCESSTGFPVLQKQTFSDSKALSVDTQNAKTEYYVGEKFSIAGVKVTCNYANLDEPFSVAEFSYDETRYNPDVRGKHTITIYAMGFSQTYTVSVRKIKVEHLQITPKENKTLYVGDKASIDDFDISYVLENGTVVAQNDIEDDPNVNFPTDEIEIEDLTYSLGENQIFAVCGDIRSYVIVDAVEREFTSIEIDTANSELGLTYEDGVYKVNDPDAFKVGDKFDAKDVAVKAYYTNSSATTFALRNGEAYLDVDPSELEVIGEIITKGENEIILSYGPYVTCTIALNVVEEEKYTITFLDENGDVISTEEYSLGDTISTPTNPSKASDNVYDYAFTGWDKNVVSTCEGNATYTATYTKTKREYIVTFKLNDGSVILTSTYNYGDKVLVPTATKQATKQSVFVFTSWDNVVSNTCVGDATYTAIFTEEKREYTVTFQNDDGTVLLTSTYHYDDVIVAPENPIKASDSIYYYEFNKWNPTFVEGTKVIGNATYVATYTATPKDSTTLDKVYYTVKFLDWDGTVLSNKSYKEGESIVKPANPTRKETPEATYEFDGWDRNVVETCQGDVTYTATYVETKKEYTVTFKNWDDKVIISTEYKYGEKIYIPTATRSSTNTHKYVFANWDKSVSEICVGDAEYKGLTLSRKRFYIP